MKVIFKKGIAHKDIIIILNILTTHFQIVKANDFSLLKVQDFPQTSFVPHQPFWKDFFWSKKFNYGRITNKIPLICKFSIYIFFPLVFNFFIYSYPMGNMCKPHLPTIGTYSNASMISLLGNKQWNALTLGTC